MIVIALPHGFVLAFRSIAEIRATARHLEGMANHMVLHDSPPPYLCATFSKTGAKPPAMEACLDEIKTSLDVLAIESPFREKKEEKTP